MANIHVGMSILNILFLSNTFYHRITVLISYEKFTTGHVHLFLLCFIEFVNAYCDDTRTLHESSFKMDVQTTWKLL